MVGDCRPIANVHIHNSYYEYQIHVLTPSCSNRASFVVLCQILITKAIGTKRDLYDKVSNAPDTGRRNADSRRQLEVREGTPYMEPYVTLITVRVGYLCFFFFLSQSHVYSGHFHHARDVADPGSKTIVGSSPPHLGP